MKRSIINTAAVFVLFAAAFAANYLFFSDKDNVFEVGFMKAYIGDISRNIKLSGVIDPSDFEEIYLPADVEVMRTYVQENSRVNKGDMLAELDSSELMILLQKSHISLEQLQEEMADLKSEKSDSLEIQVQKSREKYDKAKGDFQSSYEDLAKMKSLYEENAISQAEYEKYEDAVKNLESTLNIAQLEYSNSAVEYNEYMESIKQSTGKIQREIRSLELEIESINNKIGNTRIYSSVNGVVTEFPLVQSRKTSSGSKIVVVDNSSYKFKARAAQEDAVVIKEGQSAVVIADGMNSSYEGQVVKVGQTAEIDTQSGSRTPKVEITIRITQSDGVLKSGYEGSSLVKVDEKDGVLIVRNECIRTDEGGRTFVFAAKNSKAQKIYVETGLTDGYLTEVTGIEEGDAVIVNPPAGLDEGAALKLKQ